MVILVTVDQTEMFLTVWTNDWQQFLPFAVFKCAWVSCTATRYLDFFFNVHHRTSVQISTSVFKAENAPAGITNEWQKIWRRNWDRQ